MVINSAANSAFRDQASGSMKIILRIAITILPITLIGAAYYIFKKKFIITEEYYDEILKEIVIRENALLSDEK